MRSCCYPALVPHVYWSWSASIQLLACACVAIRAALVSAMWRCLGNLASLLSLDVTLRAAESCAKSIATLDDQRQFINGFRKTRSSRSASLSLYALIRHGQLVTV